MTDEPAEARLREFLEELRGHFQFSACSTVDVNTRGCTGDTPLKIAAVRQDVVATTDLLEAGADPNVQGEDGFTPLHWAATFGNVEIVRLLLAHGASPRFINDFGKTPVEIARTRGYSEIVVLLNEANC